MHFPYRSIHLSNNSIQSKYENGVRSKNLPDDNMWHSLTFREYLAHRGQGQAWDEIIYPGMKKAIICSLLSTQDTMCNSKVCRTCLVLMDLRLGSAGQQNAFK